MLDNLNEVIKRRVDITRSRPRYLRLAKQGLKPIKIFDLEKTSRLLQTIQKYHWEKCWKKNLT